jgi:hypothetical protein
MTTAGGGTGDVVAPVPRRPIGGAVAVHAGMLGAMALAMWPGSRATDQLAALALLVGLGLVIAPLARIRAHLVAALVDLAAMGAMVLAMIATTPATGGHAHGGHAHGGGAGGGGAGTLAEVAVAIAWALARLPFTRTGSERVLAAVTALSLIAMPLLTLAMPR